MWRWWELRLTLSTLAEYDLRHALLDSETGRPKCPHGQVCLGGRLAAALSRPALWREGQTRITPRLHEAVRRDFAFLAFHPPKILGGMQTHLHQSHADSCGWCATLRGRPPLQSNSLVRVSWTTESKEACILIVWILVCPSWPTCRYLRTRVAETHVVRGSPPSWAQVGQGHGEDGRAVNRLGDAVELVAIYTLLDRAADRPANLVYRPVKRCPKRRLQPRQVRVHDVRHYLQPDTRVLRIRDGRGEYRGADQRLRRPAFAVRPRSPGVTPGEVEVLC